MDNYNKNDLNNENGENEFQNAPSDKPEAAQNEASQNETAQAEPAVPSAYDSVEATRILDSYLASQGSATSNAAPVGEKEERSAKKAVILIATVLIAMAVGFFGAVYGVYYACSTSIFKDTSVFDAFVAKWSGITENKIEIESIDGSYTGDNIEIAEKMLNYCVLIRTVEKNVSGTYNTLSQGSGVIFSYDPETGSTVVITNHHVVANGNDVRIQTYSGKDYAATVKAVDSISDLAILTFTADETLSAPTLSNSDNLKAGQYVGVAGNPLGGGFGVTFGYISQPKAQTSDSESPLIQLDATVNPGNSGGGAFDSQGNLIGIIVSKAIGTNIDGIGYAIPANKVKSVVNDLLKHGYVTGRPAIGITVITISTNEQYEYYTENDLKGYLPTNVTERRFGVYVVEVTNTASGIKKGDRLLSIDKIPIISNETISGALGAHEPDTTVSIVVERVRYNEGVAEFYQEELKVLLIKRTWADSIG